MNMMIVGRSSGTAAPGNRPTAISLPQSHAVGVLRGDNASMTQGKRISTDIGDDALKTIQVMGTAAKVARLAAGEGQAAAAARLGVHVQTIGRIEAGEPGVSIGHMVGLLALYGVGVQLQQPKDL